eukprot:TRINITY_DN72620_c0_g1_i2.p2 TRINITY_DN72620_c0_g1~~TRINITY_DN72620_c0_g1_i2.p2  ORF type:complete len:221 (+),score=28.69 TRINITY_DN72620_c0_g1_i2:3-665(+)
MVPVILGQQPGVLVVNSGLQAANYTPIMYNNNNTPVQLAQLQMPLIMQPPVLSPQMLVLNSKADAPKQYPLLQNTSIQQSQQPLHIAQQSQQQRMYSEADSSQKEKQGQNEGEGQSINPQFSLTLRNMDNQDNIFSDVVSAPLPSMCPSPPPLPEGCDKKEFKAGQLFDFDRCLQEFSKSSTNNNNNTSDTCPLLDNVVRHESHHHMDDILQLLFHIMLL